MSVKVHSLFLSLKSTILLKGGGWSPRCHFFLFSPPCSLPRSFLPPVHASGIPPDPLNEGHIAGLAERGEWERRGNQGNSVCERERERGSTGLVFHDCTMMADVREKEQRKLETFFFFFFISRVLRVSVGLVLDSRM